MSRGKKALVIDELEKLFSNADIGILTEYRGIKASGITVLRRTLEKSGIKFKVAKNTLARFAAAKAGKPSLVAALNGPIAIAFGSGGASESAKAVLDYIRATKSSLTIVGGFIGNKFISSDEVKSLAVLPPREVLIASVLGGLQSPIAILLAYLTAPMRDMVGVLQARIKQLEAE